jgi:hypothetical protein
MSFYQLKSDCFVSFQNSEGKKKSKKTKKVKSSANGGQNGGMENGGGEEDNMGDKGTQASQPVLGIRKR